MIFDHQPPAPSGSVGLVVNPANPPAPLNFNFIEQSLPVCCRDFTRERRANPYPSLSLLPEKKKAIVPELKLYPNPNRENVITLQYKLAQTGRVQVSIYNSTGVSVLQKQLPVFAATTTTILLIYTCHI